MTTKKSGATSLKIYNPKYLVVTPFTDANTVGQDSYVVEDVVRDSTTITQEDNEENPVESEFSSTPIVNNVTAGSYTFAAEVGDLQGDLAKALAGFDVDTVSKRIYAPSGYKEVYAKIELVFAKVGGYIAAILPKVQLNTTVLIESLNSSVGRLTISGIGYNFVMTDDTVSDDPGGEPARTYTTPFMIDPDYTLPEGVGDSN